MKKLKRIVIRLGEISVVLEFPAKWRGVELRLWYFRRANDGWLDPYSLGLWFNWRVWHGIWWKTLRLDRDRYWRFGPLLFSWSKKFTWTVFSWGTKR